MYSQKVQIARAWLKRDDPDGGHLQSWLVHLWITQTICNQGSVQNTDGSIYMCQISTDFHAIVSQFHLCEYIEANCSALGFFFFFFRHILMTAFFVYYIKQLHSWRRQCNCVHGNRVRFYVSSNLSFNYVAYIVFKWQGCGYRIMTTSRNKSPMLTKKTTEWGGAPPMSESRPWPAIAKLQR